jgi:hypothetical protein
MKSNRFLLNVNLGRLRPVVDPHLKRGADGTRDPDECPPACPDCGCLNTFWFIDTKTTEAVLICCECVEMRDNFDAEGGA